MNIEDLNDAIRNFRREVMSPEIYKPENTSYDIGDFLSRIDSYQDETQMLLTYDDKEKEAAYVRYIFEMASEEFL